MTTKKEEALRLYKAILDLPRLTGGPIEGPLSEHVAIPLWKIRRIHEAIRLSRNYRQEVRTKQNLPETCLDRTLEEAWTFSADVLNESRRESRNAKIRNKLTPLANAICLIEELEKSHEFEHKAIVSLLMSQKDALIQSLEDLKKLV